MKQFIAYIYLVIVLFCVLNTEGQTQSKFERQNQIAGHTDSGNFFYSSGYSDIIYNATNKETGQSLINRLLPLFQKFPFDDLFTEKRVELTINNKISDYIYIAECHVIRFEGPDIIHPFNYFW